MEGRYIDGGTPMRIGPANFDDGGNPVSHRGCNQGALIVQELQGRYAEATRRGQMYIFNTTAAAILLTNTTANGPTIWNLAGSGFVFVPVALRLSFVSGTTTIGACVWSVTNNAGSAIGTAAPIVTFTHVAPVNALLGSTCTSHMRWAPTTSTFTAAPTNIAATGINLGAAAPTGMGTYETLLDGQLMVMPGNALTLNYTVATSTALFWTTIWGMEIPLQKGM